MEQHSMPGWMVAYLASNDQAAAVASLEQNLAQLPQEKVPDIRKRLNKIDDLRAQMNEVGKRLGTRTELREDMSTVNDLGHLVKNELTGLGLLLDLVLASKPSSSTPFTVTPAIAQ